jgi:hypothetical protein
LAKNQAQIFPLLIKLLDQVIADSHTMEGMPDLELLTVIHRELRVLSS